MKTRINPLTYLALFLTTANILCKILSDYSCRKEICYEYPSCKEDKEKPAEDSAFLGG